MERDFAEEWQTKTLRFMARPAVAENVRARIAVRALEVAHVLDNTESGYIDLSEHGDTAPRIDQRQILRRRNKDRARQRHLLRKRERRVTGTGRHIDNEHIELAPLNIPQHLPDR